MSTNETEAAPQGRGAITYEPDKFGSGTLTIELPIHPPAPREHLIKAVSELRRDATPGEIAWSVDQVAQTHLQEATGSAAFIRSDAQQIHTLVHVPGPPPLDLPTYGEPVKYSYKELRPLTLDQEALLPHLTRSVRLVVPAELDAHITEIAYLAAQEIPSQADVLRAYQRTSVAEVIRDYDGFPSPSKALPSELQQAMRTTLLSFPQHATEALHTTTRTTPSTRSATVSARPASHGYDR